MRFFVLLSFVLSLLSCHTQQSAAKKDNTALAAMFDQYWERRMQLYPLEATFSGDNRYNDRLPIDIADTFRDTLVQFYNHYLNEIDQYDRTNLNENDRISYDIFKREMQLQLEGLTFHDNEIPFQQFWGLPLTMGQLGSGQSSQPFKTVADYNNWISRAQRFATWTDSAIVYFKKGMAHGRVLPKALVVKMIPQLQNLASNDTAENVMYSPVNHMPATFTAAQKDSLQQALTATITTYLLPSYARLAHFLQQDYLPKARATTGISALPQGTDYYKYLVRVMTTTNMSPDQIYTLGVQEVKRIRGEMERIKDSLGFKGDLNAFFEYMKTNPQFMPYRTPQQVLAAFEAIHQKMEPHLKTMFGRTPKTGFEIRQTEAFRAASASAEYMQGTPDGSRPGIFYVPILDAATFNTTSGMESLFLHEAIPGHHYQISLQQEAENLPKFRRFGGNGAYIEGWALYCESLGKELGLYTDPYQYMGALGDEIHRAIRLVVDVGMHQKGMTREEAIKYMMDNEAASTQYATMEIERYMAIPAQALSYKIGALKIRELRNKYAALLGDRFTLSGFHDELLKDGAMPLDVLERKLDHHFTDQKQ